MRTPILLLALTCVACCMLRGEEPPPATPTPDPDPNANPTKPPSPEKHEPRVVQNASARQVLLRKYQDTIEEIWEKTSKASELKSRTKLLEDSKKEYLDAAAKAEFSGRKLNTLFSDLLENVDNIQNFRVCRDPAMRDFWIGEAFRVFVSEVPHASDLSTKRNPSTWFDDYADKIKDLKDKCSPYKGVFDKGMGIIQPVFGVVLKASQVEPSKTPIDEYQENLNKVKRLFPLITAEQKVLNGKLAPIFEGYANDILKARKGQQ